MDQANPYQAPEPVLPTATEVHGTDPTPSESTEDLQQGLKLLRVAVIFFCITTVISGFWHFCDAYYFLIDDPLKSHSEYYSYWLSFALNILAECLALAGVYFCSTRKLHNVSRTPLLISLSLGAAIFPDDIFQFALEKPWIYFEGYGNAHAGYAILYLANLSWLALNIWLILWTTAQHDLRNHRRVLLVIFLDAMNVLLLILVHTVYMLLLADQPLEHSNHAIFYFLSGLATVALFVSNIISFKIYSSLLVTLSQTPGPGSHSPALLSH